MREDQALSFHRAQPRRYELTGLRTGSIRDQIMRAQMLAERLLNARELAPGGQLLILGGGACGATLALAAIKQGVNTTLLEKEDNPFSRQMRARSRWLDPSEYDWPHAHWHVPDMDWKNQGKAKSPYALHYKADSAPNLAAIWATTWAGFANKGRLKPHLGELRYFHQTDASKLTFTPITHGSNVTGIEVSDWQAPGGPARTFDVVVSCIGFVDEHVSVLNDAGQSVHGPRFWHNDDLAEPRLGLSSPASGRIRVLISGGGDGAQQDLQRVLTGTCAKDLAERCLKIDWSRLDLAKLLAIDDSARRSHIWSDPTTLPLNDLMAWEAAYESAATNLFQAWTPAERKALLQQHFKPDVEVTWLMREPVMTFGFSLNKLLTLLVIKLHAEHTGRPIKSRRPDAIVIRGQKILHVKARGHDCANFNGDCSGLGHAVVTAVEHKTGHEHAHGDLGHFDMLVLRHGVNQGHLFGPPPVSEQIIPLYLPS